MEMERSHLCFIFTSISSLFSLLTIVLSLSNHMVGEYDRLWALEFKMSPESARFFPIPNLKCQGREFPWPVLSQVSHPSPQTNNTSKAAEGSVCVCVCECVCVCVGEGFRKRTTHGMVSNTDRIIAILQASKLQRFSDIPKQHFHAEPSLSSKGSALL